MDMNSILILVVIYFIHFHLQYTSFQSPILSAAPSKIGSMLCNISVLGDGTSSIILGHKLKPSCVGNVSGSPPANKEQMLEYQP